MTGRWTRGEARLVGALAAIAAFGLSSQGLRAETMESALARAYMGNPNLNAQRAQVRVIDETVPIAKAGQRPRLTGTADAGLREVHSHSGDGTAAHTGTKPAGIGATLTQTLYDGLRTKNNIRSAESQVFGARETLRNNEQNVLLNGATSYMNVLRDTAILNLQRANLELFKEQLRQTRDRFNVGEVTRTDVAQAEAAVAGGEAAVSLAESNLKTSIANFRRDIGVEPKSLAPGMTIERYLPKTQDQAIVTALIEHPAINGAMHGVDVAELQVKVAEGALFPTLGVNSSVERRYEVLLPGDFRTTFQASAVLNVPIYEGGEFYARTRQAKETAGQARINVDVTRDQVRAGVVSSWGALQAAKAQILAQEAQVNANAIALNGVREEAKVGQRTTLDILNAQQALLNSRVALITAQRDRVVQSFTLMSAIGKLSARTLALRVEDYDAKIHYQQVKDKWIGLRTPDGR